MTNKDSIIPKQPKQQQFSDIQIPDNLSGEHIQLNWERQTQF